MIRLLLIFLALAAISLLGFCAYQRHEGRAEFQSQAEEISRQIR